MRFTSPLTFGCFTFAKTVHLAILGVLMQLTILHMLTSSPDAQANSCASDTASPTLELRCAQQKASRELGTMIAYQLVKSDIAVRRDCVDQDLITKQLKDKTSVVSNLREEAITCLNKDTTAEELEKIDLKKAQTDVSQMLAGEFNRALSRWSLWSSSVVNINLDMLVQSFVEALPFQEDVNDAMYQDILNAFGNSIYDANFLWVLELVTRTDCEKGEVISYGDKSLMVKYVEKETKRVSMAASEISNQTGYPAKPKAYTPDEKEKLLNARTERTISFRKVHRSSAENKNAVKLGGCIANGTQVHASADPWTTRRISTNRVVSEWKTALKYAGPGELIRLVVEPTMNDRRLRGQNQAVMPQAYELFVHQ